MNKNSSVILEDISIDSIKGWAVFHPNDWLMWWTVAETRKEAIKKIVTNYKEDWPTLEKRDYWVDIIWITPSGKYRPRP